MNGIFQDTFNGVDDTMEVNCVDNIITSKNIEIEVVQMVANKLSDHNMFFADVTFKTRFICICFLYQFSKFRLIYRNLFQCFHCCIQCRICCIQFCLQSICISAKAVRAAYAEAVAVAADKNADQAEVDAAAAALEELYPFFIIFANITYMFSRPLKKGCDQLRSQPFHLTYALFFHASNTAKIAASPAAAGIAAFASSPVFAAVLLALFLEI